MCTTRQDNKIEAGTSHVRLNPDFILQVYFLMSGKWMRGYEKDDYKQRKAENVTTFISDNCDDAEVSHETVCI